MASFREIRSILLQSFDDGDISEDEFLLLYDDNLNETRKCILVGSFL